MHFKSGSTWKTHLNFYATKRWTILQNYILKIINEWDSNVYNVNRIQSNHHCQLFMKNKYSFKIKITINSLCNRKCRVYDGCEWNLIDFYIQIKRWSPTTSTTPYTRQMINNVMYAECKSFNLSIVRIIIHNGKAPLSFISIVISSFILSLSLTLVRHRTLSSWISFSKHSYSHFVAHSRS